MYFRDFTIALIFLALQGLPQVTLSQTLPTHCDSCEVVHHYAFTASYNEAIEQSEWITYETCRAHITDRQTDRQTRPYR